MNGVYYLFFPDALLPKVIKEQRPFEDVYNEPKAEQARKSLPGQFILKAIGKGSSYLLIAALFLIT